MAAPGTVYNKARLKLAQAAINLGTADVRSVLVTSGYVPNIDTDEFLSVIGANEVTTNGAARVALANKALTLDTTNDRAKFDCDDFEFGLRLADRGALCGGLRPHRQRRDRAARRLRPARRHGGRHERLCGGRPEDQGHGPRERAGAGLRNDAPPQARPLLGRR
jgi:hypothetical protein